ncbi:pyridoxine 5'-phosphate synthase [Gilvimarinus sp. SDUM040013]|uniref:Pyridoxine 5'-phosphate synthase n=1 Tax=Gilvimarinus gilvus TaxID=3058038 RepID=A0ABU4RXQ9_9GAMM|nr:pyridoxine 5'-phosphate synthase [Gilvimarinus sp. SDUM040013]MDO3386424.1 pyridoxine 5'-phosphate synthase [Gilvimarinus sp. SDUM040013]MDX6849690.1 pyridoxine 5'-phosphate synthase [Gilvimarinus sp. SDUM040013]
MSTALSVNLNKIALIRNSREGNFPNVYEFGELCLAAGAAGLTVHPRPDQRHIRPIDVRKLAQLCRVNSGIEFNIEGNPFAPAQGDYPGLLALVAETRPDQCTLVPDSHDQLTSDHGFDLHTTAKLLEPVIQQLKALDVRISLFMDPNPEQIRMARDCGADRIELYTGPYAQHYGTDTGRALLQQYDQAARVARECGLGINAGHDLNLSNLPDFLTITGIEEVSIGHALTVDALKMGMSAAVKSYLQICQQ